MNNLTNWDPLREMMTLRSAIDRMFDSSLASSNPLGWRQMNWDLALDVAETEDEFIVKASLPGVNPEDIDVTYDSNVLTIKGEIRKDEEIEEERYHRRERRFGSFSRSISLPSSVKGEKVEASYETGVLTLHLPKSEEAKPKKIKVHSSEPKKMIEGKATSINKN
jgi:HSP20 family protein